MMLGAVLWGLAVAVLALVGVKQTQLAWARWERDIVLAIFCQRRRLDG